MNSALIISDKSGQGSKSVSIGAPVNTGRNGINYGNVIFKADGCSNQTVSVYQAGAAPNIKFDNSTIYISKDGGSIEITGKSNCEKIEYNWDGSTQLGTLPSTYKVNNTIEVYNATEINPDLGETAEFTFKITISGIPANTVVGQDKTAQLNIYGSIYNAGTPSVKCTDSMSLIQRSIAPTLSISPTSISLGADGTAKSVSVTSNTNWTVE